MSFLSFIPADLGKFFEQNFSSLGGKKSVSHLLFYHFLCKRWVLNKSFILLYFLFFSKHKNLMLIILLLFTYFTNLLIQKFNFEAMSWLNLIFPSWVSTELIQLYFVNRRPWQTDHLDSVIYKSICFLRGVLHSTGYITCDTGNAGRLQWWQISCTIMPHL